MPKTTAEKLADINGWIVAGNSTLPLLFGLANLIVKTIRPDAADIELTADNIEAIHAGGARVISKVDAWVAENPPKPAI